MYIIISYTCCVSTACYMDYTSYQHVSDLPGAKEHQAQAPGPGGGSPRQSRGISSHLGSTYATGSSMPGSPVGAAEALALLQAAPTQGRAAIAILQTADDRRFIWQRKTLGYPVPSQVGGLCCFGGNAESGDVSARATLARELSEELGLEDVAGILTPFSRFTISACAEVMAPKPAYTFICCVFHATLPSLPATTYEGEIESLSADQLRGERFCWGYGHVLNAWASEVSDIEVGDVLSSQESVATARCNVCRIASDADIGTWAGGEAWA